jgi:hypothetical protein
MAQEDVVEKKLGQRSRGNIEINGQTFPCEVIAYNAPPEVVETAIVNFMAQRGKKPTSRKGMLTFRGIEVPQQMADGPMDAFVQIEPKSRSEKDKSVVKVLLTKPDQIADKKTKDANSAAVATMVVGTGFVTGFDNSVTESAHQSNITGQEQLVQQADREVKKLEKDMTDLQNQLTRLQKEMKDNQTQQDAAKGKLQAEIKKLETIRAKKLLKME